MEHAWTMEEVKINVTEDNVTKAACVYCNKELEFEQPEYSDNPNDVTIQPAHDCSKLPSEEAVIV